MYYQKVEHSHCVLCILIVKKTLRIHSAPRAPCCSRSKRIAAERDTLKETLRQMKTSVEDLAAQAPQPAVGACN